MIIMTIMTKIIMIIVIIVIYSISTTMSDIFLYLKKMTRASRTPQ